MIDGTNPRILADNIRDIKKQAGGLDSRVTALEVTAPKDYSTTETATGQKWINGKDIYKIVISGSLATISSGVPTNIGDLSADSIIQMTGCIKNDGYVRTAPYYVTSSNNISVNYNIASAKIYLYATSTISTQIDYNIIVFYTKPDPTPETRDDDTEPEPEPEVKETKTRKKTTK